MTPLYLKRFHKCLPMALVFSLIFFGAAIAQTRLVQKVDKKGDEVVIPFEKYVLNNGLTLIVTEDHSDPLVHVDVTYHVGSSREEIGKSGFAHFFEHMMFSGSKHVANEELGRLITEAGGTYNGSTNSDFTHYYETIPENQLETILWLESDRMGWLLDSVTQRKFEIQRATVKNEKAQHYDNSPYGQLPELEATTLYPYGHPYSWLTIGYVRDLDRVDVTDLRKFFLRWYGPNNATIAIGGDVNPKEVVKLVEKYFGNIPRGPEVDKLNIPPVSVDKDRYVSYEDPNIRFPALVITFPSVPHLDQDEPALDCLAGIMGSGRGSYLYKRFVESKEAIFERVSNGCQELGGEFTMMVLPFPGKSLGDFEDDIMKALQDFEVNGVKDEDIQKFKSQYEAGVINGLATVSGKVNQLVLYETYLNNPDFIGEELRRYNAVTKEDVIRVYEKYIKDKPKVVISVLPQGQGMKPAAPDNFTPQTEGKDPYPTTNYSGLSYQEPKSGFDRWNKPVPGAAPLVKVPDYWQQNLPNGIKCIGTINDEIPTVAISFSIRGGQQLDATDPSKAGLASLTAAMMNESTKNYSAQEISEELEKIGSSITVSASSNFTTFSVRSLIKNLDRTLEIFQEKLFQPRFDSTDFDRVKKQTIESLKSSEKDPESVADNVYYKLVYGNKNIFSLPVDGKIETVEGITLNDVRNFYRKNYTPVGSHLVIVGDIRKDEIMKKLSFLSGWKGQTVDIPEIKYTDTSRPTQIYFVNKDGAPQSQIRIGYMTAMPYDATGNYFKSVLMDYPLGMAFNSRINLDLREDKGWTYGAGSYFESGIHPGPFTASAGVKASVTDSAVYEFMKQMTDYRNGGITDNELNFMKKSIGQRDALRYEAPYQKAVFLSRILIYNLKKDYVDQQKDIINSITKPEIDELAKKHLQIGNMDIVVVGDSTTVYNSLHRLNYKINNIDVNGDPLDIKMDLKK